MSYLRFASKVRPEVSVDAPCLITPSQFGGFEEPDGLIQVSSIFSGEYQIDRWHFQGPPGFLERVTGPEAFQGLGYVRTSEPPGQTPTLGFVRGVTELGEGDYLPWLGTAQEGDRFSHSFHAQVTGDVSVHLFRSVETYLGGTTVLALTFREVGYNFSPTGDWHQYSGVTDPAPAGTTHVMVAWELAAGGPDVQEIRVDSFSVCPA